MAVYNRDNIQYGSMLQNMLANRARGAEIRANNIRKQGEIWGGAVKDIGGMIARGVAGMSTASEDEQELAKLQKEREELLAQEQAEQERLMKEYSKDVGMIGNEAYYADYRPNVVQPNYGNAMNPYAIPGNPYASQQEYFDYIRAMNGVYGG